MSRLLVLLGLLTFFTVAAVGQPTALTVDARSREEVRQFYRAIYPASENVPMAWTGSYATGNAGDTSAAFKEATRLRINFFRALAGVPAGITFSSTYAAKAQQAALMMSANNTLQHLGIPTNWTFYSALGAEAAANSNLFLGGAGPAAIAGYVADAGDNNRAVGHRRWLFYPQTRQMGTGDVPGVANDLTRQPANAVWIVDVGAGAFGTPRPATRGTAVAYPPAGFVPHSVVWPRWSFSYPAADFSAATVTMSRAGQSVPVRLEPLGTATAGEPTLVWVYDNLNTDSELPHAAPAADVTYTVNVNNVRIAGAAQNFSYNVTVFDPEVAGADATPVAVTGSASPALGTATVYAVAKPTFAASFDWRTLQLASFSKVYHAEAGLDGLIATTNPGYNVVQTALRAGGTAAYHLAHPDPRADQVLLLPETFHVVDASAAITFASRLGFASSNQVAHVQVSTDEGMSWLGVYRQAGTTSTTPPNNPTETAFTTRSVSLAGFVGRTLRVRFVYAVPQSGAAFPQTDAAAGVGWFIDNLTLNGVQSATPAAPTRVAAGTTFSFNPATAGSIVLQARGVLFGAYPLEWGPGLAVTALDTTANNNPGRLVNMSIRTNAGTGDNTLIVGVGIGGGGTSGDKAVLLRAVGPTLAAFGVGGALPDSVMTVFQGQTQAAQNDDWAGGFDFGSVGAFAFASPSRDAAIYNSAAPSGSFSIQITGKNNATGVALAEVYDATPMAAFTASTPRLVNVAARTQVGTGDNILIAGFVVGGSTPVRVLVRAVGPTLGVFGVGGVLADPRIAITSEGRTVAESDNWGGTAELKAAFASVAAFAFATDNSRDAALVVTLQPGNYTAQVSGVNNTTGVALVEVYEVP